MNYCKMILGSMVLFLMSLSTSGAEHKELKAFPQSVDSLVRHVIVLEKKTLEEEGNFQVEIIAGKTVLTDGVNTTRMATSIETEPLKGWGYTYYVVTGSDQVMSTMMAPVPHQPKIAKFVGGKPITIRYNSRLPIVIYAKAGIEVQYRIWEAPVSYDTVDEG